MPDANGRNDSLTRRLRFVCEQSKISHSIDFYGILQPVYPNERLAVITSVAYREVDENDYGTWNPPAFSMTRENAQELMDALYHCGIRPTDAGESVGALSATKFHLEDMRRIVFDTYGEKDE